MLRKWHHLHQRNMTTPRHQSTELKIMWFPLSFKHQPPSKYPTWCNNRSVVPAENLHNAESLRGALLTMISKTTFESNWYDQFLYIARIISLNSCKPLLWFNYSLRSPSFVSEMASHNSWIISTRCSFYFLSLRNKFQSISTSHGFIKRALFTKEHFPLCDIFEITLENVWHF